MIRRGALIAAALLASPAYARDSLGIYGGWGAFRDAAPKRCYAISQTETNAGSSAGEKGPFATMSWWPENGVKGQFHARLSYPVKPDSPVYLVAGGRRWRMKAQGQNVWALSARHDAFITAQLRSASVMRLSATGSKGGHFVDSYGLKGAASALDAAALGCAKGQ